MHIHNHTHIYILTLSATLTMFLICNVTITIVTNNYNHAIPQAENVFFLLMHQTGMVNLSPLQTLAAQ